MLVSCKQLLHDAATGGYSVSAFNVYNLEGVLAVVRAAKEAHSPFILQLHPVALRQGGELLVQLCLAAARNAVMPACVHLDHIDSLEDIRAGIGLGMYSVMVDGSHLPYGENRKFTCEAVRLTHEVGGFVEAELGRLSGAEDGLTLSEKAARMTDPRHAADFVIRTEIDALAVCVGNVHGNYVGEPKLDFSRLAAIRESVNVPLVLHRASGLPEFMVRRLIESGVVKFNVNTEVRSAYLQALRMELSNSTGTDLLAVMDASSHGGRDCWQDGVVWSEGRMSAAPDA